MAPFKVYKKDLSATNVVDDMEICVYLDKDGFQSSYEISEIDLERFKRDKLGFITLGYENNKVKFCIYSDGDYICKDYEYREEDDVLFMYGLMMIIEKKSYDKATFRKEGNWMVVDLPRLNKANCKSARLTQFN